MTWPGVVLAWALLPTVGAAEESTTAAPDALEGKLACRLASYGKFQDSAWTHLPSIGVRNLFLSVPEPSEVEALRERLDRHGLKPLVIRGQANLAEPGCVAVLAGQLEICQELGVHYMFLSAKHDGVDKETACQRLREAGEVARRHDVTIALETHPDLGTNADVQFETMKRVDHPNIRVNFDTGNISYYNEGVDTVAELEDILPYVATVELKDHDLKPRSWFFPALGRGKVDFPGIVRLLRTRGFDGPITIEVEGVEGETWSEAQTKAAIAESVDYLRKLGVKP